MSIPRLVVRVPFLLLFSAFVLCVAPIAAVLAVAAYTWAVVSATHRWAFGKQEWRYEFAGVCYFFDIRCPQSWRSIERR